MENYAFEATFIVCAIVAIGCFLSSAGLLVILLFAEDADPNHERARKITWMIALVLALLCAGSSSGAGWLAGHLSLAGISAARLLGLWYLVGLTSRFILLAYRHEVLRPYFRTEWIDVIGSLFLWGFLGPLATLHMLWRIIIKREDPLAWLNN